MLKRTILIPLDDTLHSVPGGAILEAPHVERTELPRLLEVLGGTWQSTLLFLGQIEEAVRDREAEACVLILREGAHDFDRIGHVVLHDVVVDAWVFEPLVLTE